MQRLWKNLPRASTQSVLSKSCWLIIYVVLLLLTILVSIKHGAYPMDELKAVDIILAKLGWPIEAYWTKTEALVVWNLRLARSLLALLAGAGLAIAGVAMQAAVKNPLADPYILGISSGASAGATAVIAADLLDITAEYSISIGAFGGACLSMLLLFLLNNRNRDSVRLLLSGCVISILFSSISSVIMFMAKDKDKVNSVVFWLMGSMADANWQMLSIVFVAVAIGFTVLMVYHRQLNALLLGDETAHTLGVNTAKLRWQLVLLVAMIVGSIVAFCGMIGFIGFVIPHIARSFCGADHRLVVPVSAGIGGIFLLWCDIIARNIVIPEELPIGIITSLIGAPFFIYVLRCSKYNFGGRK